MTHHPIVRLQVLWLLCAVAVLASSGCGFKIERLDPDAQETIEPQGFESPQAAFSAMQAAAEEKDFRKMTACITVGTARTLAAAMLRAVDLPDPAIDRVLKRHGIDPSTLADVKREFPELLDDLAAVAKVADHIESKRVFVADLYEVLDHEGDGPVINLHGKLEDLHVEALLAQGVVARDGRRELIGFRKEPIGWQVHIDVGQAPRASAATSQETQPDGKAAAAP